MAETQPVRAATTDAPGVGRLMSFSDAVFAIAITLLALQLGQPKELVGEQMAIEVLAHRLQEGFDLARLAEHGLVLALQRRVRETHAHRELGLGSRRRGLVGHHDLVGAHGGEELLSPLGRLGGIEQPGAVRPDALEGGGRPLTDGNVIGVPRHPVRPEGEHGVRLHVAHDLGDTGHGLLGRDIGASAIRVVEPHVLPDAEHGETRLELRFTDRRQGFGRPAFVVERPRLSAGRGDAHHAMTGVDGGCHDPRRQVRLVVGVGPHAEDGPQLGRILLDHERSSGAAACEAATKRSSVEAAAPESMARWAAAMPSSSEWATLATNRAAPALRTTMSRWAPASPSTMPRTRAALTWASPPRMSWRSTGFRPSAAGWMS